MFAGCKDKKRISSHGFALNYSNNISLFDYIIPCGISDKKVTSMQNELGAAINSFLLKDKIMLNFKKEFSFSKSKVVEASFFKIYWFNIDRLLNLFIGWFDTLENRGYFLRIIKQG